MAVVLIKPNIPPPMRFGIGNIKFMTPGKRPVLPGFRPSLPMISRPFPVKPRRYPMVDPSRFITMKKIHFKKKKFMMKNLNKLSLASPLQIRPSIGLSRRVRYKGRQGRRMKVGKFDQIKRGYSPSQQTHPVIHMPAFRKLGPSRSMLQSVFRGKPTMQSNILNRPGVSSSFRPILSSNPVIRRQSVNAHSKIGVSNAIGQFGHTFQNIPRGSFNEDFTDKIYDDEDESEDNFKGRFRVQNLHNPLLTQPHVYNRNNFNTRDELPNDSKQPNGYYGAKTNRNTSPAIFGLDDDMLGKMTSMSRDTNNQAFTYLPGSPSTLHGNSGVGVPNPFHGNTGSLYPNTFHGNTGPGNPSTFHGNSEFGIPNAFHGNTGFSTSGSLSDIEDGREIFDDVKIANPDIVTDNVPNNFNAIDPFAMHMERLLGDTVATSSQVPHGTGVSNFVPGPGHVDWYQRHIVTANDDREDGDSKEALEDSGKHDDFMPHHGGQSHIAGLEMLGHSHPNMMASQQIMDDDREHALRVLQGPNVGVLPLSPHSDEKMEITDPAIDELGDGALALLGIDPRTIQGGVLGERLDDKDESSFNVNSPNPFATSTAPPQQLQAHTSAFPMPFNPQTHPNPTFDDGLLSSGQNFPPPGQNFPPPDQNFPPSGQNFPPPGQNFPHPGQNFPPPGQNLPPPGQNFPPPGQFTSDTFAQQSQVPFLTPPVASNSFGQPVFTDIPLNSDMFDDNVDTKAGPLTHRVSQGHTPIGEDIVFHSQLTNPVTTDDMSVLSQIPSLNDLDLGFDSFDDQRT